MTAPTVLLAYAALLATIAGPILRRAAWPERAPRLGIATWQALSASAVVAVVLGCLTVAVPVETLGGGLAHLVEACAHVLHTGFGEPQRAVLTGIALLAGLVTVLRIAHCLGSEIIHTSRLRRALADALVILGSPRPDLGVTLVQGESPVIYCLPGRSKQVVVTTGALRALSADQLQAALAHERSHLSGRHHLVIAAAAALARAIPIVPLFTIAHDEVCRLIEMLADDEAGLTQNRTSLAAALAHMAGVSPPEIGLGAGGPTAVARVRRLEAPRQPLGRLRTLAGAGVVAGLLLVPTAMVAGPAVAAMQSSYCQLSNEQLVNAHRA